MPEHDAPRLRGVLHLAGFFVALVAGAALLAIIGWRWSLAIYVGSLATMLGVSAGYHRGTWGRRARAWWQRADHAAIFVFIAGTYTPVCVLAMAPGPGHALLAVVWGGDRKSVV